MIIDAIAYKTFTQRMSILSDTIDNAADTSAQDALMQANRDKITGWRWTAVLEFGSNGRGTCLSCAGLDGTLYPVGEGPSMPLHSDCRCFKTPVTYFQDIGINGGDFDELTGAYLGRWKEGEIRGDYDEWFAGHADRNPEALKKMLGPNRYALYESGQMSFSDFVNPVTGKRWTLAEIAAGAKGAIGPGGVAATIELTLESISLQLAFESGLMSDPVIKNIVQTIPEPDVDFIQSGVSSYNPEKGLIKYNLTGDGPHDDITYRHEYGHHLDRKLRDASITGKLKGFETVEYNSKYLSSQDKLKAEFTSDANKILAAPTEVVAAMDKIGQPERTYVNDFFGAMTLNEIGGGHSNAYYDKRKRYGQQTEAFANYIAIKTSGNTEALNLLKKYAPGFTSKIEDALNAL